MVKFSRSSPISLNSKSFWVGGEKCLIATHGYWQQFTPRLWSKGFLELRNQLQGVASKWGSISRRHPRQLSLNFVAASLDLGDDGESLSICGFTCTLGHVWVLLGQTLVPTWVSRGRVFEQECWCVPESCTPKLPNRSLWFSHVTSAACWSLDLCTLMWEVWYPSSV